jgi:hypothetical protein
MQEVSERVVKTVASYERLGESIGIDKGTISKWCREKNVPKADGFVAALTYLRVGFPDLGLEHGELVFRTAAKVVSTIGTEYFKLPAECLSREQLACLHFFVRQPRSFEVLCLGNKDDLVTLIGAAIMCVGRKWPKCRMGSEEARRVIGLWLEPYVVFYVALNHREWELLDERFAGTDS